MDKSLLIAHLKMNYIFYLSIIISSLIIAIISNSFIIEILFSYIVISFLGYVTHLVSHENLVEKYYRNFRKKCRIKKKSFLNKIIMGIIDVLNFHNITHHDTSINKHILNILFEAIHNMCSQSLGPIILIYLTKCINLHVIFLWGIMYATVHNINYVLFPSKTHEKHHINERTNYGIDVYDILNETKYDNTLENINHYAINIIIITLTYSLYMTSF